MYMLHILISLFQDFDLDETFGAVAADEQVEGVIELKGQMNAGFAVHEMKLKVSVDEVDLYGSADRARSLCVF